MIRLICQVAMTLVELLTVTDTLPEQHPTFSIPSTWSEQGWSNRTEPLQQSRTTEQTADSEEISNLLTSVATGCIGICPEQILTGWLTK